MDTAALTGEPLPRHLPDPRLGKHSHTLLSGFIVQHGQYADVVVVRDINVGS